MSVVKVITALFAAVVATTTIATAPSTAAPEPARASTSDAGLAYARTQTVRHYLYPTSRTIKSGETARFSGTVTRGRRSAKVLFQHYSSGRYRTIGTGYIGSTGKFRVSGRLTSPGTRKVRMVIPGNSYWKTYYSYPSTIRVYRWIYLSDMDWVDYDSFDEGASRVNGVYYAHSLVGGGYWYDDGYVQVDLRRRCTLFNAKAGQSDTSERTDGVVQMETYIDGSRRSADQIGFGQSVNRTVSVGGGLRLSVSFDKLTDVESYEPVWGDAKVLCSF